MEFLRLVNRYWIMLSTRGVSEGGLEFGKSVALRGSVESGALTKFGIRRFVDFGAQNSPFLEFRS